MAGFKSVENGQCLGWWYLSFMPYEVTATKKRPRDFDHLTGQEFVVSTLKNAVSEGKIAHAYLFSGPRGVGKTSAARILAKAVNCEKGPTAAPCGECSNCREISSGRSMDVIEIDGASNTSVNDIREIKDEVLFSPTNSRYKVYIIDEVHMLSNSAFNALLKTIEEPPPYIIFIFATTEIHKVPATIRSRCQQFNFRLISMDLIKASLEEICRERSIQFDEDALFWIAKEATGSLRDGYTLFDQVESFSENHITLKKIRNKLGLIGLDHLNELASAFVSNNSEAALSLMDRALEQGISVEQFIVDLTEYFRNILFLKNGIHRENLLGYSADRFPPEVVEAYTAGQLEKALEMLFQIFKDIRFSVNPRFELELLVSRLSGLSRFITNNELVNQLQQLKKNLAAGEPEPSRSSEGESQQGGQKKKPLA